MAYNPKDHYFRKAKAGRFVARSIFKLEEIDQKYKIFRKGQRVLDLGAAPGSWSQYVSKVVGGDGKILGIDLKPVEVKIPGAQFIVGSILELNVLEAAGWPLDTQFDVVMSDMAPSTTGIKSVDQAKSLELCEMALQVANGNLRRGGHFVCKLFHGGEFEKFRATMRAQFEKVEAMRPDSTRSSSKEIFLIGLRRRG